MLGKLKANAKRPISAVVATRTKPFFDAFSQGPKAAKCQMQALSAHLANKKSEVRLHVSDDILTIDKHVYGVPSRLCLAPYKAFSTIERFLRVNYNPTHVVMHPMSMYDSSLLSKCVTSFLLLFTTLRSTAATDLYVDSQTLYYINRRPRMTVLPKCCMTFIHAAGARVKMKPSSEDNDDKSSYYHFDLASIRKLRPNIVTGIYQLSIIAVCVFSNPRFRCSPTYGARVFSTSQYNFRLPSCHRRRGPIHRRCPP